MRGYTRLITVITAAIAEIDAKLTTAPDRELDDLIRAIDSARTALAAVRVAEAKSLTEA